MICTAPIGVADTQKMYKNILTHTHRKANKLIAPLRI